jgi:two-component system, OmpR family, phosphate regulon sensor histidine kinase PhoR
MKDKIHKAFSAHTSAILIAYLVFLGFIVLLIIKSITLKIGLSAALSILIYFAVRTLIKYALYQQAKMVHHQLGLHRLPAFSIFETKEKRIREELQTLDSERLAEINELKEQEKFRREFLGNISHELKTPIFTIQGYILTLLDGAMEEPNLASKYLNRASKSIERINNILEDLDFITKLEAGAMSVKPVTYDLHRQIIDVFDQMEPLATEANVKLNLIRDYDPPIMVKADPKRIEQVLVNIIQNAVKYCKSENGKVEVSISEGPQVVKIFITDNGLGIPKADLPRIFERFYRVEKSRARDAGGSGLGLAIVKHIMEAHKQRIEVQSEEGIGSTFSFTLAKV